MSSSRQRSSPQRCLVERHLVVFCVVCLLVFSWCERYHRTRSEYYSGQTVLQRLPLKVKSSSLKEKSVNVNSVFRVITNLIDIAELIKLIAKAQNINGN